MLSDIEKNSRGKGDAMKKFQYAVPFPLKLLLIFPAVCSDNSKALSANSGGTAKPNAIAGKPGQRTR